MKFQYYKICSVMLWMCSLLISCGEQFITVDPPRTQVVGEKVFENDRVATATVTGIYSRMIGNTSGFASGGIRSISLLAGLCADELINHNNNTSYNEFFTNALNPLNGLQNSYCWNELYQYIYSANSILEKLPQAQRVTVDTKEHLMAEAKFIRAFCYFYLVNLYGPIPLYTTTNYLENKSANRQAINEVYGQVIKDLKEAYDFLPADYAVYGNRRVRPTKWAAAALLSRTYLYTGDWENAEIQATLLIDNPLFQLTLPKEVFLANSGEAVWQLARDNGNAFDAELYVMSLQAVRPSYASIRESVVSGFNPNDLRVDHWIHTRATSEGTFSIPAKYKEIVTAPVTEYSMVFRLAEQYLIRAEARAHQPSRVLGEASAEADLNVVRHRAGLESTIATNREEMLSAIAQERLYELFAEWGHRWLDLKRTGEASKVLGPLKAPGWQPEDVWFPIPEEEILRNKHITQNTGY